MVKSRAQIQREYRQRLKEDPAKYELYLLKARRRKQKNYVPSASLTRSEKAKRKQKNIEYLQRHRQKKKIERIEANLRQESNTLETSGYETASGSEETIPLTVNLPFPNRKQGARKRVSRALAKKSKAYKLLKVNYDELQMKYKRNLRSIQRMKKKKADSSKTIISQTQGNQTSVNETEKQETTPDTEVSSPENLQTEALPDVEMSPKEAKDKQLQRNDLKANLDELTPKSKTKHLIKEAGLTQKQSSKVKKQLLLSFVVQTHIMKQKRGLKPAQMGALRGLIGGKILSKYRLGKSVSKSTGLGRNRLKTSPGGINPIVLKRTREIQKYRNQVIDFLKRDDNSRSNPGKADKIKSNGTTNQTRTLTDYLRNLHQKFLSENPRVKLSLSSFCRIRPKFIKTTAFISRSCCLCTKHQNMALCVQAIKKCGLIIPTNPEEFIADDKHIEKMQSQLPYKVDFGQWKRVPVEEKGQQKMKMKIVDTELEKEPFLEYMTKQIEDFRLHVSRVKRQYSEIHSLKENLTADEVIMHMDFAENYSCKTVDEIQSAYWNQTGVTLHPAVIYFKDNNDNLQHKSYVVISDEMGHNSSTVLSFLDIIIPEIKIVLPNVKTIHYWTDSPTSQYRNKVIFHMVANHKSIYGMNAVWNYFESGHGKGPCDGLGGTTKRMADEAVKNGKTVIQDATEFYAWTKSKDCSLKSVKFLYVASEVCHQKASVLSQTVLKPVKGTMKIHAVVGQNDNTILIANVSCYCRECLSGNHANCQNQKHWTVEIMKENITSSSMSNEEPSHEETYTSAESKENFESVTNNLNVGDFVAAVYKQQWYIGRVLQVDEENEVEITFMKHSRQFYQWPCEEDVLWVKVSDVLQTITEPIPTGKSKRMFKILSEEVDSIEQLFSLKMRGQN